MKLYKRGKNYYFKPTINGKQRWVNTHETEYIRAKTYAEDFIHDKRYSKTNKLEFLLWNDFCDKYLTYSNAVKSSCDSEKTIIKQINSILGIKYLKELDEPKIRQFLSYRKNIDKVQDNTLNRQLHIIKSMWTFATEHLNIDVKSPAKLVKDIPVSIVRKIEYFTLEQRKKILEQSNPLYMKILCWLMLSFALRLKEAANVKWNDINFNTNKILIHPFKTKNSNPNPASLTMPDDFVAFIKTVPKTSNFVCGKEFKTRKDLSCLSQLVKKQFKRIVGFGSAHICRHTWITFAINNPNIKERDIMKYARITDAKILDAYGHYTKERETSIANSVYATKQITPEEIDLKIKELLELKNRLSVQN